MKVLIVRAGALGDLLLLRRAIGALRRAGHTPHLLAPESVGVVLVGPGPSEVQRLTALDGPAFSGLLAGASPGSSLEQDLRADAVLALTESGDVIDALRPFAGRVVSRSPHPKSGQHASVWCAAPVRGLGAHPAVEPEPLEFTPAEEAFGQTLLTSLPSGFLAIHPGSGSRSKNWPEVRFQELVRELAPGDPFLLVSGPADEEATQKLARSPHSVVARDLPLRALGALLSKAGLYVGNDSGVTHLAAASGSPTLALFGPTDPQTWGPVGKKVEVVRGSADTMEGLTVAQVVETARRLRDRASPGEEARGD